MRSVTAFSKENRIKTVSLIIVLIGVAVRILFYLQNRNLIIDEANVARNIYERNFTQLALPLSYEQYAPPVFLWIIKCMSVLFGFSEYALRLYPLIAGCISLYLLYAVFRKLFASAAVWYPLYLFASAAVFIRFSSELKQYMPDVLVAIILIRLALRAGILNTQKAKFILMWCIAGSVAIWASMPSVFMLSGVFLYYAYAVSTGKKYDKISVLVVIGLVWLIQFAAYYFLILKPQVQSSYLQNYHQHDFIIPLPTNGSQLEQDGNVLLQLIARPGGHTVIAIVFNLLLLIAGIVAAIRHHKPVAFLLIIPVTALIIASALHQYSMAARLILFAMIPVLILMGYGIQTLMKTKYLPVKIVFAIAALICCWNNSLQACFQDTTERENLTPSLVFVKRQNIVSGDQLYIHSGAVPAFVYYTGIHPAKKDWNVYANAHLLQWQTNYDSLAGKLSGRNAFLFTTAAPDELNRVKGILNMHLKPDTAMDTSGGHVYIYK